jgi:hypothetical protein
LDFHNADRIRQVGIEGQQPFPKAQASVWDIGMRALRLGVNASIRAARAMHGDVLLTQSKERLLQIILHRLATGLALPSIDSSPMVGDFQLQSHPCESSQL